MTEKEQLQVEAIKNGTVIDHIPAGQALNILKHFHILDNNDRITVGFNLPSKANGHKDLIKVENVRFTEEQANQLSIFAPNATVNIIEDYKVVEYLDDLAETPIDGKSGRERSSHEYDHDGEDVFHRFHHASLAVWHILLLCLLQ